MSLREDVRLRSEAMEHLHRAIRAHQATVGLVGLGYVGLPLLVAAAETGFPVMGIDVDPDRVASLRAGRSYVVDVGDEDLRRHTANAWFGTDPMTLTRADVIIVAVPTPLSDGVPDLSLVQSAMVEVARILRPGQLVILESTTYPGTTEEVVLPILKTSGLRSSHDFFLGYSPERIDPGRRDSFRTTPKIVSGVGDPDRLLTELFYRELVAHVVVTPTTREAEMAKLVENTFRQVNIALVNELTTLAREIDVDIWAAIDAAATKPFGFMPFFPGPGVGGHCIAIDPSYLSWRVGQRMGFNIGFVEHAKEVNNRMPAYTASRVGEALNDVGKPVKGSRIMALGVAYKAGVNDVRESPAMMVLERLAKAGAECSYHDPYVPSVRLRGQELRSHPLHEEVLASQDCVVILTGHPDTDYRRVTEVAQLVFDARGVTRHLGSPPNVVRL